MKANSVLNFFACASVLLAAAPSYSVTQNYVIGGINIDSDLSAESFPLVKTIDDMCTGIYLGKNVVITAAHCLEEVGHRDATIHFNPDSKPSRGFECVSEVITIHPNYDPKSFGEKDLALVKMQCGSQQATINRVKAIGFPINWDLRLNSPFVAYGRGRTEGANRWQELHRLELISSTLEYLEAIDKIEPDPAALGRFERKEILCFNAHPNHSLNFGDSGGPIGSYAENGEFRLHAVTSFVWGLNDGGVLREKSASCGVSLKDEVPWIKETMDNWDI